MNKYWSVFSDKGMFIPIKDYECVIDAGSARPIAMKKINYDPCEVPIMDKAIASLAKLNHVCQVHDGPWPFKALLTPKPHQKHVTNIDSLSSILH